MPRTWSSMWSLTAPSNISRMEAVTPPLKSTFVKCTFASQSAKRARSGGTPPPAPRPGLRTSSATDSELSLPVTCGSIQPPER
eukprot:7834262-Pyramimonas_sp.AAC.1